MVHLYKNILAKLKSYQYKNINVMLILLVLGITILGINVISSARPDTSEYYIKQIFGFSIGVIGMIVIGLTDYRFILRFSWIIYIINLLILLGVKFFGENHMGAQRWIEFGPIQIQPSEFAKIFLILFFAKFLETQKEKINSFKILAACVVFLGLPLLLILDQPDLSTSIVIVLVFCMMIYIAGLSCKIIAGVFAVMIPVAVVLIYLIMQPDQKILENYQYMRLVGFFDEDNEEAQRLTYQQDNAEMAIGSGGLWGKGLHNDSEESVKNGNYIPEPQTDFIFAIVGEELGFVGTASVIILLLLISFECFKTAAKAPDMSGKIICCGVGAYISFQSFINICVVTNMMPNTGLPLPFVSYGLSSLLTSFAGIGFVLNVALQKSKKNFDRRVLR